MGTGAKAFIAAASLSFAFGSIHSFGAILEPLEKFFAIERATVSFGYSLAIVCLTLGVLSYTRVSTYYGHRRLAVACCGVTAIALAATAALPSFTVFLLAYGLVFGFSNGLCYALFLDVAAGAFPARKGLATGLLTAAYGVGAATFSLVLGYVVAHYPPLGFLTMAIAISLAGFAAYHWLPEMPTAAASIDSVIEESKYTWRTAVAFWIVYVFAASGGLMMLGHAAAIMTSNGADHGIAYIAVLLNALGNIAGSAMAGWLSDRVRAVTTMMIAILIEGASFLGLMFSSHEIAILVFLTFCGYAYGSLTAAVPLALRALSLQKYFGMVFTAWGVAGLVGPVAAGTLFDRTGSYSLSIVIAAILAAIAMFTAWRVAISTSRNQQHAIGFHRHT